MKLLASIRWQFILWAARRLPPCCHVAHRLSDSLQERPSLRERIVLKSHLFVCEWCTRYAAQLTLVQKAVRNRETAVDHGLAPRQLLSDEARERFRRALKAQSE
jgi:hypothetical protein